jgi:regulatory protein
MNNNDHIKQVLEKLRQICSRQEKSPADVLLLLKKWGMAEEQDTVLGQLKKEGFVDEKRYARAFVADKLKFDHWGKIKIRYVLYQKGIPAKDCDNVLSNIDPVEYSGMVERELRKKRKTLKGTPREVWAKLARYGASRGYEMEIMQAFLGDQGEDD